MVSLILPIWCAVKEAVAAQRCCGRRIGLALMSCPLLVAGVTLASPAHADATSYLNDLHNAGINAVGGDAALLQMGQQLCGAMWNGMSPQQLEAIALQRSDTDEGARGVTPQQAADLVNFATKDLCQFY